MLRSPYSPMIFLWSLMPMGKRGNLLPLGPGVITAFSSISAAGPKVWPDASNWKTGTDS